MNYDDEIRAIIAEEQRIVGKVALAKANELEFLTVYKDGTVDINVQLQWEHIEELIQKFGELQGQEAAVGIAKRATEMNLDDHRR